MEDVETLRLDLAEAWTVNELYKREKAMLDGVLTYRSHPQPHPANAPGVHAPDNA